jgi:H+-transporting ATPase
LQLLLFFFFAVFAFHPSDYNPSFPDFFHMPVLMLMLITLLNDGTLIAIGYDNVNAPTVPTKWNLTAIFMVGLVLAVVACVSSLLLLYLLLDSWNDNSLMAQIGLENIPYGSITTSIYLKVSVSDFLTLFSSRTGGEWFWKSRPANILLGAAGVALSSSLILSLLWPDSRPDKIDTSGLERHPPYPLVLCILGWCIVWWFVQDLAKVVIYKVMHDNNWFGVNQTGQVTLPESTKNFIAGFRNRLRSSGEKPKRGSRTSRTSIN